MMDMKKYQEVRKKKVKLSLGNRLTLLTGAVVLVSLLVAIGIAAILEEWFPILAQIPFVLQIVICLLVAMIATRMFSSIFFDPIKEIRQGMQRVAEGDFSVRLETKSSSLEVQEMFAGFNMMAKELESTEILQSDFISNVSHEFKTPINAIEGYATLLQSTENIDEVENAYIEKILFSTQKLSSLVSNILLMSKIENQTIPSNRQDFRLDEQIREVIVGFEREWEPKDLEFDVELEDVIYEGDDKLLYHVWSNLLGNAIKFSPKAGLITMKLYTKEADIVFEIENQGPEIAEEALKHIFDKFYQEDTSHRAEGNGLGLALVKKILVAENGTIGAKNLPEGGCRFTVTLTKN